MRQRGNKYTTAEVKRAGELYEAGWTNCTEISRMLRKEFGRAPHPTTIRKWADPDYYEAVRMRERTSGVSGPNRFKPWKLRLERIRELRAIEISCDAIAKVVSHDFNLELTDQHVERMLRGELGEPTMKRLLYPEGAKA